MIIEKLKPSELVSYEKNARTHSAEQVSQIVASIKEFGFTNPVLIDEDNVIIAGHGRTQAAKQMQLELVPCVRITGLDENRIKALRIADNQLALNAGWDIDLLAAELSELETDGFDLDVMGFDSTFLDEILDGLLEEPDESDNEEFEEAPEPEENPVTVLGDLWLLGDHRVMCGDSTNIKLVQELTNNELVSLLLTDPPYNVAYEGKTEESLTIQNDDMSDGEFRKFLSDVYSTADYVMKPGAVFYIWHADSEGHNFRGAAHDVGWQVRQCLIWNKNSMVLGRQDYHWKHEPCLYGWKDGAAHYWGTDRKQTTILDFNRPLRNGEHPTMKPVELMEYQIKNSSKRGEIVLDLFGGSGSTLIACELVKRKARLMELDPKYVDVIVKRWENLTGQNAIHLESGLTFDELEETRTTGKVPFNIQTPAANDETYEQKQRA